MYDAVRGAKNETKDFQIIFSSCCRQDGTVISLIQRFISCKSYSLGTLVQRCRKTFKARVPPISLTCISLLLEISVISFYICHIKFYIPCTNPTLKRKVWMQRPCLAVAPRSEPSGSRGTQFSPTSRGSGGYPTFQGTTTYVVLHRLRHLSP